MIEWFAQHHVLLAWMTSVSIVTFIASLLTLPWLVSRIPEDYFLREKRRPGPWKQTHPAIRLGVLIGKNALGITLLVGGLLMLFLPGQGLLTMAMGMLLTDYPGKFRLERRVVQVPQIFESLNWLRAKRGAPPLEVDGE